MVPPTAAPSRSVASARTGAPCQSATARAKGWRGVLLALMAYGAITAALFWPVLRGLTSSFPMDLGDPPNEAWLVAWGVHALTTAPSQLLDGNIYYPHAHALIYNDNLLGLLPLSTPIFLLSDGNTALTYNVLYLLSFALCGLGTFLLALEVTGSVAGAFLAGIIVAYSPYRMVHLSHLNQLSGQWVPFALLCWERARRICEEGGAAQAWPPLLGLGAFFALEALCSLYYAVFLAVCLLLYLGLYSRRIGLTRARRFTTGVVITALLTAAALAPFLRPYLGQLGRAADLRGPQQVLAFQANLADFLHMPTYSVLYGWTERALGVPGHDARQYLFPGLVALALAWLGWRGRRLNPAIRVYGILLIVTAVLALGLKLKAFYRDGLDVLYNIPLPFALLYDHLPGFHSFRDPARFFYIGTICLGLLAAWGLGALLGRLRAWRPGSRAALVAVLCALALAEYWITPIPAPPVAVGGSIPPVYIWLKAQPADTPVLELPIGQQNAAIWSQQALMTYYATYHWRPIVNGVGGYTPSGYERDATTLARWPDRASLALLQRWGVRYVIWHPDWVGRSPPAPGPQIPLARRWPDGTSVYRVISATR